MATLIGELRGRSYDAAADADSAERSFIVRAALKTDDGPDVISAVGIPDYQDFHPRNASLKALEFSAEQDPGCWWKWIVTVSYSKPDKDEDDNPLDRAAEISYSTESIMVAANYSVDQGTGDLDDVIGSTAGEPFDPAPEIEIEIQLIDIRRFEAAAFSVALYYGYQNATNSNAFTFGDLTVPIGKCKLRASIGKEQEYVDPDQVSTLYREVNYSLAINPLGWDLDLLDSGSYYLDGSDKKKFLDEYSEPYIGLLDGSGGDLGGGTPVFLNFPAKKRLSFVPLALPTGP